MKQLSLKRGFCLMLSVVVSCFFMLVFFCNLSHNSSLSVSASGSGHTRTSRVSGVDESTIEYSGEGTWDYFLEWFAEWREVDFTTATEILGDSDYKEEFLSDLFAYGASLVGSIFSDDTTFSSVSNSWLNYMYDSYLTDGEMSDFVDWAFYYGSDGYLHFTEDFIDSLYDYIDPASYQYGIVQIPPITDGSLYTFYSGIGSAVALSAIQSYTTYTDGAVILPFQSKTVWFTSDLTTSSFGDGYGLVLPFSSYSNYTSYLTSTSASDNFLMYVYKLDSDADDGYSNALPVDCSIRRYSVSVSSNGTYSYTDYTSYPLSSYSYFRIYPNRYSYSSTSSIDRTYTSCHLVGSALIDVYISVDWFLYYNSGSATSGVVWADTGDVYGALTELGDYGAAEYQLLQDMYNEMLSQGSTLDEIKEEISSGFETVSDDTEEMVSLLEQILDYVKKINNKLLSLVTASTVDTVADTVTALTSLVGAAEDFVDDIVDDVLDGTFDTVLDALIESEYYTDLLSSFNSAFPFSLPYDFFLIVNLLAHDPVTPEITWRMKFDSIGFDEVYSYDFSAFDSLASVTRVFSSLLFIIALIKITMRLRKKE